MRDYTFYREHRRESNPQKMAVKRQRLRGVNHDISALMGRWEGHKAVMYSCRGTAEGSGIPQHTTQRRALTRDLQLSRSQ
ncbi:uncharacterized [Tachysurus ichikawai]